MLEEKYKGRGTGLNPKNRFEKLHIDKLPDEIESGYEELEEKKIFDTFIWFNFF